MKVRYSYLPQQFDDCEDLWRDLDDARKPHNVTWEWVKGHSGNTENDRADLLARLGMAPFQN